MAKVPVAEAFWGLTDTAQFERVRKNVVDHQVVESPIEIEAFQGVLEPLPERELVIKPEGQRGWNWYKLWTAQKLKLDDEIKDPDALVYRVMSASAWNRIGGYYEYQLTEGPTT